ncbi:hypothetical protein WICMUC_000020 [Wickerhamomyces mucosus]|uniref:Flavoprotein domain-containing protein n=1 Tax=Wickerhamomyces mucosus TaxID=1378264 RepID=A0A9P8Q1C6_9ASCO|nr:hypothetical protein WICMUC_000020 [Wickerhamomyces mucosus]
MTDYKNKQSNTNNNNKPIQPILNKPNSNTLLPSISQTSSSIINSNDGIQSNISNISLNNNNNNNNTTNNHNINNRSISPTISQYSEEPLPKISSVSFTVPDQVEKSHRGSISAKPSSLQIDKLNIGGSNVVNQGPISPNSNISSSGGGGGGGGSITTNLNNNISSSIATGINNQGESGTIKTIKNLPTLDTFNLSSRQSSSSIQSPQPIRNPSITSTINSNGSSRQNSNSNIDYLQFSPQNPQHLNELRNKSISPTELITPTVEKKKKAIIQPPLTNVPFHEFFIKQDDQKIHILIGATGSIATIKVPLIIDKLYKIFGQSKVSIQLVVTKSAEIFLKGLKISTQVKIWRDDEEWFGGVKKFGDSVLHQELRKWADILLISPLSANTLAKISNGICDNLLTSIIRSWNPSNPILVAPAMNTFMYTHPVTKKHLNILKEDCPWIEVLKPVEKVLVCGDIGMGGMREWSDIVEILIKKIKSIKLPKNERELYDPDNIIEEDQEDEDEEDDEEDEDDDDDDDDDDDEEDEDEDEDVVEEEK